MADTMPEQREIEALRLMGLARDLLAAREDDAVVAYLDLAKSALKASPGRERSSAAPFEPAATKN